LKLSHKWMPKTWVVTLAILALVAWALLKTARLPSARPWVLPWAMMAMVVIEALWIADYWKSEALSCRESTNQGQMPLLCPQPRVQFAESDYQFRPAFSRLRLATFAEAPRTIWGPDLIQTEPFQLLRNGREGYGDCAWTGYAIAPDLYIREPLCLLSTRLELRSQNLIPAESLYKSHTKWEATPYHFI
jgi:hypothetical protein